MAGTGPRTRSKAAATEPVDDNDAGADDEARELARDMAKALREEKQEAEAARKAESDKPPSGPRAARVNHSLGLGVHRDRQATPPRSRGGGTKPRGGGNKARGGSNNARGGRSKSTGRGAGKAKKTVDDQGPASAETAASQSTNPSARTLPIPRPKAKSVVLKLKYTPLSKSQLGGEGEPEDEEPAPAETPEPRKTAARSKSAPSRRRKGENGSDGEEDEDEEGPSGEDTDPDGDKYVEDEDEGLGDGEDEDEDEDEGEDEDDADGVSQAKVAKKRKGPGKLEQRKLNKFNESRVQDMGSQAIHKPTDSPARRAHIRPIDPNESSGEENEVPQDKGKQPIRTPEHLLISTAQSQVKSATQHKASRTSADSSEGNAINDRAHQSGNESGSLPPRVRTDKSTKRAVRERSQPPVEPEDGDTDVGSIDESQIDHTQLKCKDAAPATMKDLLRMEDEVDRYSQVSNFSWIERIERGRKCAGTRGVRAHTGAGNRLRDLSAGQRGKGLSAR
ncbi:unnamed protein product [Peniophora sp. CBMAI 1063]|nr:unnamed protein product [Peniophora sp. CBMAI 1063]